MRFQKQITDKLFLNKILVVDAATKPSRPDPVHHIVVVDVSGSMSDDLPDLREQLKAKLANLIGLDDTLTVIAFSGRSQVYTLFCGVDAPSLDKLQEIKGSIDRWLRPIGFTAFREPLEAALAAAKKSAPGMANSLIFMSDGQDNQWSKEYIMSAVKELAPVLGAATFVEYGYNADRQMLNEMAAAVGGKVIFAEDLPSYQIALDTELKRTVFGVPRREFSVADAIESKVFSFDQGDGELKVYTVDGDGKVFVPETTRSLYWLTDAKLPAAPNIQDFESPVYAALSVFSAMMRPKVVKALLRFLGDVYMIDSFSGCFGKQRYTDFQQKSLAAVFDPSERYTKGRDNSYYPDGDTLTVLEFLAMIGGEDRVLIHSDKFNYRRISKKRDSSISVSDDELYRLMSDIDSMRGAGTVDGLAKVKEQIERIILMKSGLKFMPNDAPTVGYPVDDLVLNKDRANVSMRFVIEGWVNLAGFDDGAFADSGIPYIFPTHIYRNYAVIADGILNIPVMHMRMSNKLIVKLSSLLLQGRVPLGFVEDLGDGTSLVHLKKLPIVNDNMVERSSARELFESELSLANLKAKIKVFKSFREVKASDDKFVQLYGLDGAEKLERLGLSSRGFIPAPSFAPASDKYMTRELRVSLSGLSSLPSVDYVKERLAAVGMDGLKIAQRMMADALVDVERIKASGGDFYKTIDERLSALDAMAKSISIEIAKKKFAILVGQEWFVEFSSLEDNEMALKWNGIDVKCKVEMKEVEVEI
jgi:hypothetical protein